MTNKQAAALGYYVREGAYQGTSDDRLGRWYVGRDDEPFRPFGPGFASRAAALAAIAEYAADRAAAVADKPADRIMARRQNRAAHDMTRGILL